MKILLLIIALSLLNISCKSTNRNQGSQVSEIDSFRKLSLSQGSGAGAALGIIKCSQGWYDEGTGKTEFAISWNQVKFMNYGELEDQFCTKQVANSLPNPGSDGSSTPGNSNGLVNGKYSKLVFNTCDEDIANLEQLKYVYVDRNISDSYDRCVLFASQFDTMLGKYNGILKELVKQKVRIFAAKDEPFKYVKSENALYTPLATNGLDKEFFFAAGAALGIQVNNQTLFVNGGFVFYILKGKQSLSSQKANCSSMEGFNRATSGQLKLLFQNIDLPKFYEISERTSGNRQCIYLANDKYSCDPFDTEKPSGGTWNDFSGVCVKSLN